MPRRRILKALGALVVVAGLALAAGGRITSPAERAARAQAPEPSQVTAPVEFRVLQQVVSARGTVGAATRIEVVPSLANAELDPVVTSTPRTAGSTVAEGDVVLEVAGRPVIVLSGALPVYRDLRPGASGPDIAQLQAALARVGFDPQETDSVFGKGTAQALSDFYVSKGYEIPLSSPDALQLLDSARRQVRAAERAVEQAAVDGAPISSRSEVLALEAQVRGAERSLATARVAQAEAQAVADAGVEVARAELARSTDDPATGAPEVEVARSRVIEAEGAGRLSRAEQAAAVASAEDELVLARARMQEGPAQSSAGSELALTAAEEELVAATEALSELERTTGTMLPRAELVFMPTLPATVGTLDAQVGATVEGSALTLESGELGITAVVPEADWQSIELGDEAVVEGDTGGDSVLSVVEEVSDQLSEDPVIGSGHIVRLRPAEVLDGAWRGRPVAVRIAAEATDGPQLVVPLSAVSAGSDGTVRVTRLSDATSELITVRAGLSAGGFVAIEPLQGELGEGDRVLVG